MARSRRTTSLSSLTSITTISTTLLLQLLQLQLPQTTAYFCDGPPSAGCTNGLWNDANCRCDCIPPFCTDQYGACALGVCANGAPEAAWKDCVAGENCPWWVNPLKEERCTTGPVVPTGVWDIYNSRTECCNFKYPYSKVCNDGIIGGPIPTPSSPSLSGSFSGSVTIKTTKSPTRSPTPFPTISVPEEPTTEVIPLGFLIENLPINVDMNSFRVKMRDIVKRVVLKVADKFKSLKILNVELRSSRMRKRIRRRRVLLLNDDAVSASDSSELAESDTVHGNGRGNSRLRGTGSLNNSINGLNSNTNVDTNGIQPRNLQRDPFEMIYDITVLREEGVDWEPLLRQAVADDQDYILEQIREFVGIRDYGDGDITSSDLTFCIQSYNSQGFIDCDPIVYEPPTPVRPPTPAVVVVPQPTFSPVKSKPKPAKPPSQPTKPSTVVVNKPSVPTRPTEPSEPYVYRPSVGTAIVLGDENSPPTASPTDRPTRSPAKSSSNRGSPSEESYSYTENENSSSGSSSFFSLNDEAVKVEGFTLEWWMIILIALGALCIIGCVLLFVLCMCFGKKRTKKEKVINNIVTYEKRTTSEGSNSSDDSSSSSSSSESTESKPPSPKPRMMMPPPQYMLQPPLPYPYPPQRMLPMQQQPQMMLPPQMQQRPQLPPPLPPQQMPHPLQHPPLPPPQPAQQRSTFVRPTPQQIFPQIQQLDPPVAVIDDRPYEQVRKSGRYDDEDISSLPDYSIGEIDSQTYADFESIAKPDPSMYSLFTDFKGISKKNRKTTINKNRTSVRKTVRQSTVRKQSDQSILCIQNGEEAPGFRASELDNLPIEDKKPQKQRRPSMKLLALGPIEEEVDGESTMFTSRRNEGSKTQGSKSIMTSRRNRRNESYHIDDAPTQSQYEFPDANDVISMITEDQFHDDFTQSEYYTREQQPARNKKQKSKKKSKSRKTIKQQSQKTMTSADNSQF